jgi:hypothetical protein
MAQNIDDILAAIAEYEQPAAAPVSSGDPVADMFTWESSGDGTGVPNPADAWNPARWDVVAEETDMGAPAPFSAPPAPLPTSQSRSVNVKRSSAGVPRRDADAIVNDYEQGLAADQAKNDARFGAESERANAHYGDYGNAVLETGKTERGHYRELLDLHKQIQDFNQTAAEVEQKIHADGQVHRETILSDYREQLAGVKAMSASTGNPLGGMGLGGGLAMGGAMFAQGFLAAQGVQIDVGGQIDKWVDRSIAEHQMKINNARQGAQDTLHLYDVARQTSQDDWEARQRFRGFVIEGFQQAIQVEAARFGSDLAMQRAAQKVAELQIQKDAVLASIGDRSQAAYVQSRTSQLAEMTAKGTLRHQKQMEAIGWKNARTAAAAAKAKTEKPGEPELRFGDPGATKRDPKTGKVVGILETHRLKKGLPAAIETDVYKKVTETITGYDGAIKTLREMRNLRAPAFDENKGIPLKVWKEHDPAYRAYSRTKILLQERLIKSLTGAAAPQQQMDRISSVLADDSIFQKGGNASALVQLENDFRQQMTSQLDSNAALERIPESEQSVRNTSETANDTTSAYNAEIHGSAPQRGAVGEAASEVVRTGHNEVKLGGGYSPAYLEFLKSTGDTRGAGRTGNRENSPGQRAEIDGIDMLAALVAKPELAGGDTVDGESVDSPEDIRSRALSTIRTIASGAEIDGRKPDEEVVNYARAVQKMLVPDSWSGTPDYGYLYGKFGTRNATLSENADPVVQQDEVQADAESGRYDGMGNY